MGTGNNRRASHPYDRKPTVQPTVERSDQTPGGPFTGPYYWVPRPRADSLSWSILTGRDSGLDPDTDHTKLWLSVLAQLATDWGKDTRALKRALGEHYTGMPRGRVTRSDTAFLINHGRDAPVDGWQEHVIQRFQLAGQPIKAYYDEHERMLPEDIAAVAEVLDITPVSSSPGAPINPSVGRFARGGGTSLKARSRSPSIRGGPNRHPPPKQERQRKSKANPRAKNFDSPRRPDADRRLRQANRFARTLRVLQLIQARGRYGVKEVAPQSSLSGWADAFSSSQRRRAFGAANRISGLPHAQDFSGPGLSLSTAACVGGGIFGSESRRESHEAPVASRACSSSNTGTTRDSVEFITGRVGLDAGGRQLVSVHFSSAKM